MYFRSIKIIVFSIFIITKYDQLKTMFSQNLILRMSSYEDPILPTYSHCNDIVEAIAEGEVYHIQNPLNP